jgi:spermidine synthase
MAFILGIGLGSAWIASARSKSSENVIIVLLCIASTWVAFLVFNIEQWVNLYRLLRIGLAHNNVGYLYNLGATTLISLLVLGFPAACIGAVLPVMIRTFSYVNERFGERVGWLLTWNTLGGVTGTLVTGFLLMPGVGLRNAFGVLASILAVVSFILAFQKSWRFRLLIPTAATAVSVSLFFCGGAGWREVMSSGIFRVRETTYTPNLMQIRKQQMKLLFYEDAPDATVSVELAGGIVTPQSIGLRINGKADAGTDIDVCNQLLLAHLPMLVKPEAKDVFVLGLGSGMTAGAVLAYPVNQVVVAENCDPVIRAARLFGDWNRHVLDHPKTHLRREDARTVLKLSPQLYDVIITEPSNPWTIGVGSVFNRDFYELAAKRLKPGGMVAQWFHLYETEDDIVALVLRTFGSVFPHIEIWDTGIGDMVILGSMEPWETGPGVMQSGFNIERVRTDMLMIDIKSPEVLMARQLASQRTGFAIANPGPIQSDLHPLVEYTGPAALFRGDRAAMLDRYDERTRQQLLAPLEKRILLAKLQPVPTQTMFGTFSTMNGEVYGCLFGTSLGAGVPCALQTPNQQPTPDSDGSLLSQAKQLFAAGRFAEAANVTSFVLQQDPKNREASYLSRIIDREKGIRN